MRRVPRFVRIGCAASMLVGAVTAAVPAAAASRVSWSVVASPNASPSEDQLSGVSCTRPSACTAVGAYFAVSSLQTLIEAWNGRVWSIVPSPNASPNLNYLTGVSCSSPTACAAVGYRDDTGETHELIESWNGQVWSIVPNPNPSVPSGLLNGVSCLSPSACTAVGNYGFGQTLIESWNGQVWSIVPSPAVSPARVDDLNSVSCSRLSVCTAVGFDGDRNTGVVHELILSWNGQVWSKVPDPNPSLPSSLLKGVSCLSPSACTAVGTQGSIAQTLIETWNGHVWSTVPSPDTSPVQLNDLTSVSCSRRSACTAVGSNFDGLTGIEPQHTLIESWNGHAWSIVPSPAVSPNLSSLLTGVSCDRDSGCTAVGSHETFGFQTLIESSTQRHA